MNELLSNIKDYLAAGAVVLTALPLLLFAKDLTVDWGKKLIHLGIAVALWMTIFQPYAKDLQTLAICVLSVFWYKIIPEDTAIFLVQIFLFTVTWGLFRWIFKVDHPNQQQEGTPTAAGFTSRRL